MDHVALKLVDYTTVIPNPLDLGTISKQLEAGRKSNWRRSSSYSSVEAVLSDSLRVFENCEVYNQNDAATRQVADDARQVFLSAWEVAGLSGPKPRKLAANPTSASKQEAAPAAKKHKSGGRGSNAAAELPAEAARKPEPAQPAIDPASCKPEAEVPARFSIQPGAQRCCFPCIATLRLPKAASLSPKTWCTGKGGLPLRLLDNFTVSGGKRGSQLTGLEALEARGRTSLTLRGALLPTAGRAAKRDGEAELEGQWCRA